MLPPSLAWYSNLTQQSVAFLNMNVVHMFAFNLGFTPITNDTLKCGIILYPVSIIQYYTRTYTLRQRNENFEDNR